MSCIPRKVSTQAFQGNLGFFNNGYMISSAYHLEIVQSRVKGTPKQTNSARFSILRLAGVRFIYAYAMLNFLMISIRIGTDTWQCSLTKENPGCGTSKKPGFLRLPLELRQKVYTHLLGRPFRAQRFETSILCVNKMIHEEAVKILYGENGVVMYHVHRSLIGQLMVGSQNERNDFPSTFKVYHITQADGRIGSEPALTVSVALQHSCYPEQDSRWRDEFERYVGIAADVAGFCKVLTACHIRPSLHLRLSLPSVEYRKFGGRPDIILDHFRECRGVGTAEIFTAGGLSIEPDRCSLMCKPLQCFDEILNQARSYRDGARQQTASRHHLEALMMWGKAYCYLYWWAVHGVELSNETEAKWTEFRDMKLETALLYASHWLRHPSAQEARRVMATMLGTYPLKSESAPVPRRLWDKESEGRYILGLCSLLEGCNVCALYNFLKALICKPGNEKVDKEIDKLEAAMENSNIPRDEIARWNIKHVLGRFRHQPLLDPSLDADNHGHRGPADMTEDDLNKLVDSFVRPLACKNQGLHMR